MEEPEVLKSDRGHTGYPRKVPQKIWEMEGNVKRTTHKTTKIKSPEI